MGEGSEGETRLDTRDEEQEEAGDQGIKLFEVDEINLLRFESSVGW